MSEPLDPNRNVLVHDYGELLEFEVEMIPDQEGIDAVIAWAKANDPKSADNGEAQKSDDPDRPAA
jgi:hypothetical protein